jgi:hypothetical protein
MALNAPKSKGGEALLLSGLLRAPLERPAMLRPGFVGFASTQPAAQIRGTLSRHHSSNDSVSKKPPVMGGFLHFYDVRLPVCVRYCFNAPQPTIVFCFSSHNLKNNDRRLSRTVNGSIWKIGFSL